MTVDESGGYAGCHTGCPLCLGLTAEQPAAMRWRLRQEGVPAPFDWLGVPAPAREAVGR